MLKALPKGTKLLWSNPSSEAFQYNISEHTHVRFRISKGHTYKTLYIVKSHIFIPEKQRHPIKTIQVYREMPPAIADFPRTAAELRMGLR